MKHSLKNRLDRISIKWRLFAYLAVFVAFLLVLLWVFQTVLLREFYKVIKAADVRSLTGDLVKSIDDPQLQERLDAISPHDGVCVRIVNEKGETIYSRNTVFQCVIHKMPPEALVTVYRQAQKAGGSFSVDLAEKANDFHWDEGRPPQWLSDGHQEPRPKPFTNAMVSMIYGQMATTSDGQQLLVLVNSVISPVDATVETLRVQLVCITIILLILSLLLAAYLSRKISAPIIKINQSAKELAGGNYDVTFRGEGYLEIAELRDTLNYAAGELSKVERLRQEFIANVSHDLRTPLTMITGYAEMMRDIPGENSTQNVQVIIDEASRLTGLVNDILEISKIQSGAQTIRPQPLDLTAAILRILERYRQLVRRDGYEIEFVFDRHIQVNGDEARLAQVVYNLINNAVTYTGPDRKVTITQTEEAGQVTIRVTDTGEGISPENLPYVWDRYYKVDKAHKRAAIGTGLGLSIVKGIVELHGGTCGVDSVPGHGSTFWFRLSVLKELPSGEEVSESS